MRATSLQTTPFPFAVTPPAVPLLAPSADPTPVAAQDDVLIVPLEKSELELQIEASIQQNPVVAWLREHPVVYHGAATGCTLVVVLLCYVALRALFFAPFLRFLKRREAGTSRGAQVVRAVQETKVVNPLAWVLPFIIGWRAIHLWPGLLPAVVEILGRSMVAIAIAFGLLAFARFLSALDILVSARLRRPGALRGYVQAVSAIVGVVGAITIIAIMIGRSPVFFLAGVGASAAILAVVLKDTLMSIYANILMTTGDTLRVGDWIEMKQYSIDGRVELIRLTSTRVRNWDETTLTIPNYRFVSDVFVNYRTQNPKGARRLRRTLRLDQRSVRILSDAELDQLVSMAPGPAPITQSIVAQARAGAVAAVPSASSAVTNLALYRAYIEQYLGTHPLVDRERPVVIRQNEPTGNGVPVDVLCFFFDSELKDYESLQAAILDHLVRTAAALELRLFQLGMDAAVQHESASSV